MKTKSEIQAKLAQLQQWKEMADRQHSALTDEIYQLRVMGNRSSNDSNLVRRWNEEYREQSKKIESLQAITIPGFCANENVVRMNSTLDGAISALTWILEG